MAERELEQELEREREQEQELEREREQERDREQQRDREWELEQDRERELELERERDLEQELELEHMNVHPISTKNAMTGITLSFTLTHSSQQGDKIAAQIQLERFATAVHQLQKEGFPTLKHTLISRQEYEP